MGQAIGDVLPFAIGVAISVIAIIALILMLITPRARSNGPLFLLGWVAGLAVVGAVVLVIAAAADVATSSGPSNGAHTVRLVLGVGLVLTAFRRWRHRPGPGETPETPKWMASLDACTGPKALGLGAALSGVNPKNLVLTIGAAMSIAQLGLPVGQQAGVLAVFDVLASLTIAAPLAVYFALGARAAVVLENWKQWLAANNANTVIVLLLVFGALLIGQAITGLS